MSWLKRSFQKTKTFYVKNVVINGKKDELKLLFPVVADVLDVVIPRAKPSVGKLKTYCKSSSFQFCASPKGLFRSLCISQPI